MFRQSTRSTNAGSGPIPLDSCPHEVSQFKEAIYAGHSTFRADSGIFAGQFNQLPFNGQLRTFLPIIAPSSTFPFSLPQTFYKTFVFGVRRMR